MSSPRFQGSTFFNQSINQTDGLVYGLLGDWVTVPAKKLDFVAQLLFNHHGFSEIIVKKSIYI